MTSASWLSDFWPRNCVLNSFAAPYCRTAPVAASFGTTVAFWLLRSQGNSSVLSTEVILHNTKVGCNMLRWALAFLVIALIAAALGFGGIAGTAAWIAKILFVVFLVLFLISVIAPRLRPPVG